MPRMNIDFSDDTYDTICLVAQKLKTSKKAAIEQMIDASTMRQQCVKNASKMRQPRERASSPSAQKEINKYNSRTEAVGSDSARILPYCKDKKNSNKAPPDSIVFMPDPDNWEPHGDFRATWCASKGYDYAIAIEIFREKFKADPQRCTDWNSKWKFFVLNGYLPGAKFSAQSNGYEEDGYGPAIGRVKTDEEVAESRRFFAAHRKACGQPKPWNAQD
jgi:hypothetical protein